MALLTAGPTAAPQRPELALDCWSEARCYFLEDMTRPQGRREQGWGLVSTSWGKGQLIAEPLPVEGISTTPRGLRKRRRLEESKQLRVSCKCVGMGVSPQAGLSRTPADLVIWRVTRALIPM